MSSNHEDIEIEFYTKEYNKIVTKGRALENEYDKIKILLMNAWVQTGEGTQQGIQKRV
jgi:hypothetical protein